VRLTRAFLSRKEHEFDTLQREIAALRVEVAASDEGEQAARRLASSNTKSGPR
jgi:hypothetical protein